MFQVPALFSAAIGTFDALIVVVYVAVAALLGIFLARGQKGSRDFFLADHRLPMWALLLSIVATETSTVTFLSIPGKSFMSDGRSPADFTFLQIAFGYIVGRFAIVLVLLPGYFRGEMLSAYQVLERHYGATTRRLASLVFLVMRNLADGIRMSLAALVLKTAFGLDYLTCVLVIAAATAVYSCCGGVRSVIWNDCLQFAVYMVGAIAVFIAIVSNIPGGWPEIVRFGETTGRWQIFDFDPSWIKPNITFWSGCIGGAFLTLATHGADHMMVQRYLCARGQKTASWALGLSGFIILAQFAFFLTIGVALACFFTHNPPPSPIQKGDDALVTYIVHFTNAGLRGLVLAAIFSASMSSSLNSVTGAFMSDWLEPLFGKPTERNELRIARALTIVFAVIQASVAIFASGIDKSVVDKVLAIAGFSTGLILGLYFLALIGRRTSEPVALAAFAAGTIATCAVAFGTAIHWAWYTLIGSGTIVIVGLVLSACFDKASKSADVGDLSDPA